MSTSEIKRNLIPQLSYVIWLPDGTSSMTPACQVHNLTSTIRAELRELHAAGRLDSNQLRQANRKATIDLELMSDRIKELKAAEILQQISNQSDDEVEFLFSPDRSYVRHQRGRKPKGTELLSLAEIAEIAANRKAYQREYREKKRAERQLSTAKLS